MTKREAICFIAGIVMILLGVALTRVSKLDVRWNVRFKNDERSFGAALFILGIVFIVETIKHHF